MSGSFADVVYWEKQGANRMCALHCMNSLVQAPLFSEFEFNKFSKELDQAERMLWKAGNESENADSTGYYSIGVLEKALQRIGGFQIVNVTRPDVWAAVLREMSSEQGFIFNLRDHWLTVRRINGRWWNLDSLKENPEFFSEAETRNFLLQTVQSGYSVFAIRGDRTLPLPVIRKDRLLNNQFLYTVDHIAKILKRPLPPVSVWRQPTLIPGPGPAPAAASAPIPISADLPTEPIDALESVCVNLGVRTKDGKRHSRKFHLEEHTMRQVVQWVRTLDAGLATAVSLWRVGPPRVKVEISDSSLAAAGFASGQELLVLQ